MVITHEAIPRVFFLCSLQVYLLSPSAPLTSLTTSGGSDGVLELLSAASYCYGMCCFGILRLWLWQCQKNDCPRMTAHVFNVVLGGSLN